MQIEARNAAVDALAALSRSSDYRDRLDAGVALSRFAAMERAAAVLGALVLDPDDTAVTHGTVEALMQRPDQASMTVVAEALTTADDNHGDWIEAGIKSGLGLSESARAEAITIGSGLPKSGGTTRLLAILRDAGPLPCEHVATPGG